MFHARYKIAKMSMEKSITELQRISYVNINR